MKKIGSTAAMLNSAATSDFLKYRVSTSLPNTLIEMKNAIDNRDFPKFARLVIKESNQLHAVCLDTYPSVMYLNDVSFKIIDFVTEFNKAMKTEKVQFLTEFKI